MTKLKTLNTKVKCHKSYKIKKKTTTFYTKHQNNINLTKSKSIIQTKQHTGDMNTKHTDKPVLEHVFLVTIPLIFITNNEMRIETSMNKVTH